MNVNRRQAYDIAAGHLSAIGYHLELAKEGQLGYFIEVENLKEHIPLNPLQWFYNTQQRLDISTSFNDLNKEDQDDILASIQSLLLSKNQVEFTQASNDCKKLGKLMDGKYLKTFLGPMSET